MKAASQIARLGALVLIAPFVVSASASASTMPRENDLESLGSSSGTEGRSSNLTLEVQKVEKNATENLLSVTWSVENTGNDGVSLTWLNEGSYQYSGPFFSAVNIMDSDSERKFHPVMDGAGSCLCSGNTSSSFVRRVDPGEQVSYWSLFSVPGDVESIDLEAPGFEPVEDITVP